MLTSPSATRFVPSSAASSLKPRARAEATFHEGGTAVIIEGPAFSTKAESQLYRSWGADLVGMTMLPEAKLAREAGICYAALACVTDYDVWREGHAEVTAQMILDNLLLTVDSARRVVALAVERLPAERTCRCAFALSDAIVTSLSLVPTDTLQKLGPIIADYVADWGGRRMAASKTMKAERLRDAYLVRRLQEPDEIRRLLAGPSKVRRVRARAIGAAAVRAVALVAGGRRRRTGAADALARRPRAGAPHPRRRDCALRPAEPASGPAYSFATIESGALAG